jgi:hypothetical protein
LRSLKEGGALGELGGYGLRGYAVVFDVDEASLLETGEDLRCGGAFGRAVAVEELGEVYEL